MTNPGTFVLLFVVATIVALAARRFRVPYTVALVITGLALGAAHVLEPPTLSRGLLFGLVLPALLFEAAFDLEIREIQRDGITLASLAVPGVIAAVIIVVLSLPPVVRLFGAPASMIPAGRSALLFAALISATDPVAVVSLFRTLDAPRRLQVIVEGESLFNDGTAIIFFSLALAAIAGTSVSVSIVVDFFYVVGAGIIVGGVIGAASAEAVRRLNDPALEVMLTTIAAYGSFAAAEGLNASGVIATVTAGLLCGSRVGRSGMSAAARIAAAAFWDYLAFALNSLVFLSIGLTVRVPTLLEHWRPIVAAFVVVTLTRTVVTTGIAALLPSTLRLPHRWTAILAWGGLRGALSMVLALSIPETYPQRALLITMTFGVVVLSILVQGITMSPALKWLGLTDGHGLARHGYAETQAALLDAHSALDDLERTGGMVARDDEMRQVLAIDYDEQLGRAERDLVLLARRLGAGEAARLAARRLLRDTERARVIAAFESGAISDVQRDQRLQELRDRWWDTATEM